MPTQRTHDNTQPNYRRPIRSTLMTAMTKRPGVPVWLGELTEATGEPIKRVQVAMAALVREGIHGLAVHTRGQAWVYQPTNAVPDEPPAAPAGPRRDDLLRVVGPTSDGAIVAEDESGALWRATKL